MPGEFPLVSIRECSAASIPSNATKIRWESAGYLTHRLAIGVKYRPAVKLGRLHGLSGDWATAGIAGVNRSWRGVRFAFACISRFAR
jgi:hypothetical protein